MLRLFTTVFLNICVFKNFFGLKKKIFFLKKMIIKKIFKIFKRLRLFTQCIFEHMYFQSFFGLKKEPFSNIRDNKKKF